MQACRFVVCLAFVFGDVRSVCVNVDSYRRCWYGTLDNYGLKADGSRLGLLDKNYVIVVGDYVNFSFPLYKNLTC